MSESCAVCKHVRVKICFSFPNRFELLGNMGCGMNPLVMADYYMHGRESCNFKTRRQDYLDSKVNWIGAQLLRACEVIKVLPLLLGVAVNGLGNWGADAHKRKLLVGPSLIDNEKCRGRCPSSLFLSPTRDVLLPHPTNHTAIIPTPPFPPANLPHRPSRTSRQTRHFDCVSAGLRKAFVIATCATSRASRSYEIPCQAVASTRGIETKWRTLRSGRAVQSL